MCSSTTLTGYRHGKINNPRWDHRDMISQSTLRNQIYDLSHSVRVKVSKERFEEITVLHQDS